MKKISLLWSIGVMFLLAALIGPADADLIKVDGSSTVFPITEAVAEEFKNSGGQAKVMVGISGTGGGFKRFCRGETDISDASRPIKDSERTLCKESGITYIELPVAYDGLAVMVNVKNTWVDHLTVKELNRIWEPSAQGNIMNWSQVRPGFPDKPIVLFGPGTDSGTFDYFTEAINGKSAASRGDYTASEDDNVLVEGIASDEGAIGYFGLAYYEQNKDKLKLVPIDDENPSNGAGPIAPSMETVMDATYQPLARPIFVYVSAKATQRPAIKEFINYYLKNAPSLVEEVGYIPLQPESYDAAVQRFNQGIKGTVFGSGIKTVGVKMADLLMMEK
ncbi:MAG TPA: PstS family phosphate ABC transporter substrate-binding protein [Candidatus Omnitrophota bacterium]|nr:PstS family phosphate ABC transporter substrate-binding protein [Candidatus Omnitrophota bacterium]